MNKEDLEVLTSLIDALKECQQELYQIHSQYGDKQNAEDHSMALQMAKHALRDFK